MNNLLKKISKEGNSKKKIENIVFLIIILIITLIIMNTIWTDDESKETKEEEQNQETQSKTLANTESKQELEERLENILSTIKGVGSVNVFVNYSESSSIVAMYDESTTTSSTQEGDSEGGTRNVTETQTQKEVVFSEDSGKKEPVTQKTTMPEIQGVIITAEGGANATIKTNIVNAVEAVTGLDANNIQVFEMKN